MSSAIESTLYSNVVEVTNYRWKFLKMHVESILALNPDRVDFAVITDLDGKL